MTEFQTELDNAWQMSDELWQQIHPLLLEDSPPKRTGRKRADWRRMINGIVYRVQTGCKWNKLPKQFGDDSTVHRWYQRWCKSGMIHKVWSKITTHCAELNDLTPEWAATVSAPPAIAGVVGQTTTPAAIPTVTPAAAQVTPEIAASAPYAPTVAIAPETVSDSEPSTPIPAQTPAAASTPQPRPQIAEETRHDYQPPGYTPAASTPAQPQHQPYSSEESDRRAA
ncbi:transposase [Symmachiella dynata]|uniref:transposase n=1 Tax=Symmachiella dynata TaxID=2527995 RepID=UPI0030ED7FE7